MGDKSYVFLLRMGKLERSKVAAENVHWFRGEFCKVLGRLYAIIDDIEPEVEQLSAWHRRGQYSTLAKMMTLTLKMFPRRR